MLTWQNGYRAGLMQMAPIVQILQALATAKQWHDRLSDPGQQKHHVARGDRAHSCMHGFHLVQHPLCVRLHSHNPHMRTTECLTVPSTVWVATWEPLSQNALTS